MPAPLAVDKQGGKINIYDSKRTSSNMPKDVRFKEMPFFDKGTGQTVFLGPGSYNAHECFARLKQVPSPFIMVKLSLNEFRNQFP
jgi:hypothetical protein